MTSPKLNSVFRRHVYGVLKPFSLCLLAGLSLVGVSVAQAASLAPVEEIGSKSHSTQQRAADSGKPGSVNNRLARIERIMENQNLVEIVLQMEALQQDVQQLRGLLEENAHTLVGVKSRQRDLYLDIDRRIGKLEQDVIKAQQAASVTPPSSQQEVAPDAAMNVSPIIPAAGVQPPQPPVAKLEQTATTDVSYDSHQEQTAYQNAFNELKQRRYDKAISEFKSFLAQYPNGVYFDNAQYWLGEAYYVTQDYGKAREEFSKIRANADSRKRADAMLKLGYTYQELDETESARKVFEDIIKQYPGSTVERLAQKRLLAIKQAAQ